MQTIADKGRCRKAGIFCGCPLWTTPYCGLEWSIAVGLGGKEVQAEIVL